MASILELQFRGLQHRQVPSSKREKLISPATNVQTIFLD